MSLLNGITGLTSWNRPLVQRCALRRDSPDTVSGWGGIQLAISCKLQGTWTRKTRHDTRREAPVVLVSVIQYRLSVPQLVSGWEVLLQELWAIGSFEWLLFPTEAFSLGGFSACPVFAEILCTKNYSGDWQLKREPGNSAQKHVYWHLYCVSCRQLCKNKGTSETIIHIQSRTLILL